MNMATKQYIAKLSQYSVFSQLMNVQMWSINEIKKKVIVRFLNPENNFFSRLILIISVAQIKMNKIWNT